MATKAEKIKLGIFTVVSAILIGGMLIAFAGFRFWARTDRYYVRVPDTVFGLEIGSPVTVRGVRTGRVAETRLHADDLRSVTLALDVDRGTRIYEDARASLVLRGVTGLRVVDVRGGEGGARVLEPGSYIEFEPTLLDKLQDEAEDLLVVASSALLSAGRLLGNLAELSDGVDVQHVRSIVENVEGMTARLEAASGELLALLGGSRNTLRDAAHRGDEALSRVDDVTADLADVVRNVNDAVIEMRGVIRGNEGQIRATVQNLREATESVKQLTRELRNRPSRLIFGGSPPERRLP